VSVGTPSETAFELFSCKKEEGGAATVEHNAPAPGTIGHIARHLEIDVPGYEPSETDRWFQKLLKRFLMVS